MRGGPLVVLGDSLLDIDMDGAVERLAPDAPVPVVDCQAERQRAGGAGLAATLAAGQHGPGVVLITALGTDRPGARLRDLLGRHVDVLPMPLRGGTPCKIRVGAAGQQLVRLDAGRGVAATGPLDHAIGRALAAAGAVLVSDYGRGVTAHPGIRELLGALRSDVPVVWDPHPAGSAPVPGVRLATPNAAEARRFAGGRQPPAAARAELAAAAADAAALVRAWGVSAVCVTLAARGALLSVGDATPFLAPAPVITAGRPADACGAGDQFAVTAVMVLRDGGVLTEAVAEAVRSAACFVSRGGASASPAAVVHATPPVSGDGPARPSPAPASGAGQLDPGLVWDQVGAVRGRGGRIVATGGCFDLLHAGHVGMLAQARRLGDYLVVCLNSDSSVRELKGAGRPLVAAADRASVLLGLESVDGVLVFDEKTPAELLGRLRPDIWVKGGDYAGAELAEAPVVRRYGGQVVMLPYAGRLSTTKIVTAASRLTASQP